jgi:hypothetical protein
MIMPGAHEKRLIKHAFYKPLGCFTILFVGTTGQISNLFIKDIKGLDVFVSLNGV